MYRAIRSFDTGGRGIGSISLKLRRQNKTPLLRVSFEQSMGIGDSTYVQHEFPVRLVRVDERKAIEEPQCPPPDLYLELPNALSEINRVIDKFKALGTHVRIRVNKLGHISFEVHGDGLRVESTFKYGKVVLAVDDENNTTQPPELEQDPYSNEPANDPSVTVMLKDLSNVLRITTVVKRIVVGVCNEYALILYCYLDRDPDKHDDSGDEEVLTYYMSHFDV
ncbi:checkpoint clamp complex protein Hus1 [Sugiyamaella lignohabitans]|uniref:Checkpoint protein n=1 Tax=Sugiyamaella lignohabitans TaxID=796027 RepID=A0A167EDV7_9ASCO|nr:checkpoint clamp complex protein Hus1 [Sugiyamaella lignohabitans]ANB13949.1 checkpoint clamp complex protein Hus1 [Sugiyamaella lignohabitans]